MRTRVIIKQVTRRHYVLSIHYNFVYSLM